MDSSSSDYTKGLSVGQSEKLNILHFLDSPPDSPRVLFTDSPPVYKHLHYTAQQLRLRPFIRCIVSQSLRSNRSVSQFFRRGNCSVVHHEMRSECRCSCFAACKITLKCLHVSTAGMCELRTHLPTIASALWNCRSSAETGGVSSRVVRVRFTTGFLSSCMNHRRHTAGVLCPVHARLSCTRCSRLLLWRRRGNAASGQ